MKCCLQISSRQFHEQKGSGLAVSILAGILSKNSTKHTVKLAMSHFGLQIRLILSSQLKKKEKQRNKKRAHITRNQEEMKAFYTLTTFVK